MREDPRNMDEPICAHAVHGKANDADKTKTEMTRILPPLLPPKIDRRRIGVMGDVVMG